MTTRRGYVGLCLSARASQQRRGKIDFAKYAVNALSSKSSTSLRILSSSFIVKIGNAFSLGSAEFLFAHYATRRILRQLFSKLASSAIHQCIGDFL